MYNKSCILFNINDTQITLKTTKTLIIDHKGHGDNFVSHGYYTGVSIYELVLY